MDGKALWWFLIFLVTRQNSRQRELSHNENDKKQTAALTALVALTGLGALVTFTRARQLSPLNGTWEGLPLRVGHNARSCAAGKVGVQSEPCVSVLGSCEHRL